MTLDARTPGTDPVDVARPVETVGTVAPGAAPATTRAPVTIVIAARDEARHIEACVAGCRWADEVVVVEHGSSDDTAALAARAGAAVIARPFTTIGAQRNAAIAQARNTWVLVVDADERCTPELEAAVRAAVGRSLDGGPAAYRVSRRSFLLRHEIRHGGWERDRPVRLFHRVFRYDEKSVHERVSVPAPAPVLDGALLHYTYDTLDQYFEKLGRYSRWWASDQHARGRRATAWQVVARPPLRFLTMFVLRRGFLDGSHGAVVAALAAVSVAAKYARLWAVDHGDPPSGRAPR